MAVKETYEECVLHQTPTCGGPAFFNYNRLNSFPLLKPYSFIFRSVDSSEEYGTADLNTLGYTALVSIESKFLQHKVASLMPDKFCIRFSFTVVPKRCPM